MILGASCAVAVAAQEPPRITLELEDAPVSEVLPALARVLDRQLESPASDRTVTTTLVDVRPLTALQVICETARCQWALGPGVLEIEWQGERPSDDPLARAARSDARFADAIRALRERDGFDQPISMSLRDAALGEVLETIGRIAGLYVDVDAGLDGEVTVELQSVALWKALEQVCAVNDCVYELDLDGETLRVLPTEVVGE